MLALINVPQIQHKTQHEKRDGRLDGRAGQDIPGLGTKRRLGRASPHRRSHAAVLGLLREHDQDHEQRNEDEDERQNSDENAHV
jgi:hypothetical protein